MRDVRLTLVMFFLTPNECEKREKIKFSSSESVSPIATSWLANLCSNRNEGSDPSPRTTSLSGKEAASLRARPHNSIGCPQSIGYVRRYQVYFIVIRYGNKCVAIGNIGLL